MSKHVFYLTDAVKTRSKDNAEVVKDLCLAVPKIRKLLGHFFDEKGLHSLEISLSKDFIKSFDKLKEGENLNLVKYDNWLKNYTGVRPIRESYPPLEEYWDQEKPDFLHVYMYKAKTSSFAFTVTIYFEMVHPGQDATLFAVVFELPGSSSEVDIVNTGEETEMFYYDKEEVI